MVSEAEQVERARPCADGVIGLSVGGYQVCEEIGRGAMGVVYRAAHPLLGSEVAVKVLREDLARDPASRSRFLSEGRAAATIRHPNVVLVLDLVSLPDGRPCLVQELLEGTPLDVVAGNTPMAPGRALGIVRQLASALGAIHARGVVHRDVKAQNVVVAAGDQVKLVDFGIAKVARFDLEEPQGARAVGTPHYMAPEQVLDQDVDARADVYALGVLTYRLLSGRFPFSGSHVELLRKQVRDLPPPPQNVAPALARAVLSALAKDRRDRPASAEDFARALDAAHRAAAAATDGAALSLHVAGSGLKIVTAEVPSVDRDAATSPGVRKPAAPPVLVSRPPGADAALHCLERYERAAVAGCYVLLNLPPSASSVAIRAAAGRLARGLADVARASDPSLMPRIHAVRRALEGAAATLLEPERRLAYDAERGNWQGVAQVLLVERVGGAAVARVRAAFASASPGRVSRGAAERARAASLAKTRRAEALQVCVGALELNPFDDEARRLHQALTRPVAGNRAEAPRAPPQL